MNELTPLPGDARDFMRWEWTRIEPYYARLQGIDLTERNVKAWLTDWTQLASLVDEMHNRLAVATTQNTADVEADERFNRFIDSIYPPFQEAEQKLKEKLLASGLEPEGMKIPLRNLRADAEIYRDANLPLLSAEEKLEKEYDKIIGAQTVNWEGVETTLDQLKSVYQDPDRSTRERAWRLSHQRRLQDRAKLSELWGRGLELRVQIAANAGFDNYRDYRWQYWHRFDYTPDDCMKFHNAIEEVVVPAAARAYDRHRARLGYDMLRPWDLQGPQGFFTPVNAPGVLPLRPFAHVSDLEAKCAAIFTRVDPELGGYFETMRTEGLLDLANRKNKAPGGYCINLEATHRPFIFMNAVGLQDDVQTLLHEAGHAFHDFETAALPYLPQREVGIEFCEVASMGMEFLAGPYLDGANGFYSSGDAARARIEKLESALMFWPFMAVVDAFQHWAYSNPNAALEGSECDKQWAQLWGRFMLGVDWDGLEEELVSGWQRKPHIFQVPFYYVDYGLAQLGALQVWRNSLTDQAEAVASYRRALALGNTVPLPELFGAAGAKFAFDAETLGKAVELMEETIEKLET